MPIPKNGPSAPTNKMMLTLQDLGPFVLKA